MDKMIIYEIIDLGSNPNKRFILKIQYLEKLLSKISHKKNTNKRILLKYSFFSWLLLKKLQKEGFIRFCIIKQVHSNSIKKSNNVFIGIYIVKPLNNLKLFSSKFRSTLKKKENFKENLGLNFNCNSNQSFITKNFGETFLILK